MSSWWLKATHSNERSGQKVHINERMGPQKNTTTCLISDSDFKDLKADMLAYVPTIVAHHDLAKVQDVGWDATMKDFPRGEFCSVQVTSLASLLPLIVLILFPHRTLVLRMSMSEG